MNSYDISATICQRPGTSAPRRMLNTRKEETSTTAATIANDELVNDTSTPPTSNGMIF